MTESEAFKDKSKTSDSVVSITELLEAGVHFGHQTRRWNPKMAPYIYMARNDIHVINLKKTQEKINEAYNFVKRIVSTHGTVLFVGTKKQAQEALRSRLFCSSIDVSFPIRCKRNAMVQLHLIFIISQKTGADFTKLPYWVTYMSLLMDFTRFQSHV